jgi:hypothetical protein
MLGARDASAARDFMEDLAGRLANRVQLTTDGHKSYLTAVDRAFGDEINYAMLVKIYGESEENEKRYSPAVCMVCEQHPQRGNPDPKHISTSYVERQNLTMRMSMRRFTRLTNAFSKGGRSVLHVLQLWPYCKHQTLGTSPAVAAGVANHIWSITEIVGLIDERVSAARV